MAERGRPLFKKKKRQQAKKPSVYVRRLTENDYVQKQLRDAAAALSKAYRRAAKGRGQAVEDKKLYSHLREAATSVRNATGALQRSTPEPEPKRRGRKLIPVAAAGGGALLLASRRGRHRESAEASNSEGGAGAVATAGSPPLGAVQSAADSSREGREVAHQTQEES